MHRHLTTPRCLRKRKPASKPAPRLESSKEKLSYALGVAIAKTFKRQGVTLDAEALSRGIDDGLSEPSCSWTTPIPAKRWVRSEDLHSAPARLRAARAPGEVAGRPAEDRARYDAGVRARASFDNHGRGHDKAGGGAHAARPQSGAVGPVAATRVLVPAPSPANPPRRRLVLAQAASPGTRILMPCRPRGALKSGARTRLTSERLPSRERTCTYIVCERHHTDTKFFR
jgi:hypothetical protein